MGHFVRQNERMWSQKAAGPCLDGSPQHHGQAPYDLIPGSTAESRPTSKVVCAKDTEPISILIADGHPIFRDGLRMLLESQPGFRVVGEAGDGEGAIKLVQQLQPEVLLLDLCMPRCPGLVALRELARLSMPVRTIILATAVECSEMVQAIQLGARAVVLKHSATNVLFDCIRTVMAGRNWVGSENVSDLVDSVRRLTPAPDMARGHKTFGLTRRELEIIDAVVAAYTNKDIAQKFSISEHTVKNHLTNIFDKLGVSNRLELALFAIEHRLTDP